jgi:putative hydrolase of the HAD superfamily
MEKIAIIFDLDETILPAQAVPDDTFDPLIAAIREANHGDVNEQDLDQAFQKMKRISIDVVAKEYGFTEAMVEAAKKSLTSTDYDMSLYYFEDYSEVAKLPGIKCLVTTGVTKFQQAKIDALGIKDDFDEIMIDDIYDQDRLGKKQIFANLADRFQLRPKQVWIVGDNPDAEIIAGKELGMVTVQRVSDRKQKSVHADYAIESFSELKALLLDYADQSV